MRLKKLKHSENDEMPNCIKYFNLGKSQQLNFYSEDLPSKALQKYYE